MCCNGELKARQECQQGSRQQKYSQVLVLGAAVEVSYALNHLERSAEMSVAGRLVRTKIWEPTSGSGFLLLPPFCRLSYVSWGRCLSSGQWPRPHTLIMPMPRALTLSPSAYPCLAMGWLFKTYLLSLILHSCRIFLSIALFVTKSTFLFPPTSQLGFTPTRVNMMSGIKSFVYLLRRN